MRASGSCIASGTGLAHISEIDAAAGGVCNDSNEGSEHGRAGGDHAARHDDTVAGGHAAEQGERIGSGHRCGYEWLSACVNVVAGAHDCTDGLQQKAFG